MEIGNNLVILTKENILKIVGPHNIYERYLGANIVYNRAFSSPFRVDRNPSFIISDNNYCYRDFATGEVGDCFSFVKKLYNVDFNGALKQIAYDLNIENRFIIPDINIKPSRKVKLEQSNLVSRSANTVYEVKVKIRKFNDDDLAFWNCAGVSIKYLKLGTIYAISHYFINNKPYVAEKYAYAFAEKKDDKLTFKIYQPYSISRKWINNNNFSVWELWNLLPQSNPRLIITSSRKDALSIIENLHIPSTALQAESVFPKPKIIKELYSRFKKIYLLLDNDVKGKENWGQRHAKKLCTEYGFTNIVIPDEYESKDFSDLVCNYDRVTASNIIKEMLI